ncbi:secondary thiamine-phosphate synthase [Paenibacillus macquariensis subsp. defensor]|uniref:Secondary thiamine-phosphate synthase enzyme n=1 Tax=Paenibacillus macquariensis TaxID=948756 RepID=A0ABY1JMA8_9BACL|nr:secondary thiamine-phosphate synthase enzyme YjbQ [Paenibacillus macquariensis]MEC0090632.1 secondary thiamine-phosphate synthase enzyme YjbQ [Paenibacillus macquariensis]OAB25049.1 secondary thiamine-phosphate synthase [Paenibacillus macquariensis subsp. macquariensis]OAB38603.1 secondary thiamine-phosphate synthase [Paenibacillus macquariensis subsp. defensor]SIQ45373.1 secondary thiamine-phosphate synthase enzyme [Paenibacillus macquariensis]
MKTIRESIDLSSTGVRPSFHMITSEVRDIVARSGVQNGICVVYSHHTTCSVMTQECSFDETYTGLEYLQQDLLDIFESIIPTCRKEGQYMHPGPVLTEFSAKHGEDKPQTLNTDAHLRSVFLGRSETIVIADGELDLGKFGHIYFIDFDQTCARTRQVQVQIMGE